MPNEENDAAGDISISHDMSSTKKNYAAGDISGSRVATLGEENISRKGITARKIIKLYQVAASNKINNPNNPNHNPSGLLLTFPLKVWFHFWSLDITW